MFMVGVSGVQGSDLSFIGESSIETNISNLQVYMTSDRVDLDTFHGGRRENLAQIPLHMIIGGRLTKPEILEKLREGAILVVHKNENNHYALYFKRSQRETTGFHLGTYDTSRASARMVSGRSSGCGGDCQKGGGTGPHPWP